MKVRYSKPFVKAVKSQSGKVLKSIEAAIEEVKNAKTLDDITDCKKISGMNFIYRIRVGSMRAFFTFHVEIVDDTVIFHYLTSRGEAYDKKNIERLRDVDV